MLRVLSSTSPSNSGGGKSSCSTWSVLTRKCLFGCLKWPDIDNDCANNDCPLVEAKGSSCMILLSGYKTSHGGDWCGWLVYKDLDTGEQCSFFTTTAIYYLSKLNQVVTLNYTLKAADLNHFCDSSWWHCHLVRKGCWIFLLNLFQAHFYPFICFSVMFKALYCALSVHCLWIFFQFQPSL